MAGVVYIGYLVIPHIVGFSSGFIAGFTSIIGRKMLGHQVTLSNFHSTNNLLLLCGNVLGLLIGSTLAFKGVTDFAMSEGKKMPRRYIIGSFMNICLTSILGYQISAYSLVAGITFFKLLLA